MGGRLLNRGKFDGLGNENQKWGELTAPILGHFPLFGRAANQIVLAIGLPDQPDLPKKANCFVRHPPTEA